MLDQEATRARVLEAAGQLFAEKGFDATVVREITDRAGTSPASVNYYFRSKEDLYVEAVRMAAHACETLHPLPTWPAGVPAEQRLRDFIHTFLRRVLENDGRPEWHRHLIFREVAEPRPGACELFVRDFVRPTFATLTAILAELAPPNTAPRTLQMLACSVIGQCLHYHQARHVMRMLAGPEEIAALDVPTLTEHVYRFSLAGVRGYEEAP